MAAKHVVRLLSGLAVLVLLAAGPAQAFPKIENWVTAQGTEVYFVPRHELPVIDLRLDFDAGESRSPAGKAGMATMVVSAILDKELEAYELERPYQQIANSGNHIGMSAGRDRASISLRLISRSGNYNAIVGVVAQQLSEARFPAQSTNYRRDWLKEQAPGEAAKARADVRIDQLLYGKHPYANLDLRDEDSLDAVGSMGMRSFHREYYRPGNLTLTVVGDVDRAQVEKMVEELTRYLPKGQPAAPLPKFTPPELPLEQRTVHISRAGSQTKFIVAYPLTISNSSPDYPALLLGNYILGGSGQRARLMKTIRQQAGLTYGISSSMVLARDGGSLQITARTRNDQKQEMAKQLAAELLRYENGPSEDELKEGKSFFLLEMEQWGATNQELLDLVSSLGYKKLPLDYYDRLRESIAKLDVKTISEAWKRHIRSEDMIIITEGPEQ